MDISIRAGQDADCNPATVAGILGTMVGYDNIPDYWLNGIKKVEHRDFKYTSISLNDVYDMSYRHALQMIENNEGVIAGDLISIKYQDPQVLPLEVAYPEVFPVGNLKRGWGPIFTIVDGEKETIEFSGSGIIVKGQIDGDLPDDYIGELEVKIDGKVDKIMKLPIDNRKRALELYWNVNLSKGKHILELKWLNPQNTGKISSSGFIALSDSLRAEKNRE